VSPSTLSALRGHISRELIAELALYIERKLQGSEPKEEQ
jgi:hypothetical protein